MQRVTSCAPLGVPAFARAEHAFVAGRLFEDCPPRSLALVRGLTEAPRMVDRGWIDPGRWRLAVERARFGVTSDLHALEVAIVLELWLRDIERFAPGADDRVRARLAPPVDHPVARSGPERRATPAAGRG